jgi:glycosyltransferase involved in cell wall biosynthesis
LEEALLTNRPLKVLHVLTLAGSGGLYGGPSRVARELCSELQNRGHEAEIFSGAILGHFPSNSEVVKESFIRVRSLSKKFSISSLWSFGIPSAIYAKVKRSDLVHIHFARELIPLCAALICLGTRTPFVTQTHGMLLTDNRLLVRILDLVITKRIIKHSKINLVLSKRELSDISLLNFSTTMQILANGIKVSRKTFEVENRDVKEIVFCSRIHSRKRVDLFLSLAKFANEKNMRLNFSIYGPDHGELSKTLNLIASENILNINYRGSLQPELVPEMLATADLLVLPSENEPFPMIVLESLSVGTPVLIMPSCGIASLIASHFPKMVALGDDEESLRESFLRLIVDIPLNNNQQQLQDFCKSHFDISQIVNELEAIYTGVIGCR